LEVVEEVFVFQVPKVWDDGLGVVEEGYFLILPKNKDLKKIRILLEMLLD
jgi:hypothetical protein